MDDKNAELHKFLIFGGRDGIRTHDLLIANEEESMIRRGATITQIFWRLLNCPTRPTDELKDLL